MPIWDPRKTAVLLTLLLLVAAATLYWSSLARRPQGTDEEQIRALLVLGERAIEEQDLGAAMGLVSTEYRDEHGLRYASLRALASRYLRYVDRIEITIPLQQLQVTVDADGDRATARAHVDLRAMSSEGSGHEHSLTLTFTFVKEPVRYYLLFPGHEWQLVSMEGWHGVLGE